MVHARPSVFNPPDIPAVAASPDGTPATVQHNGAPLSRTGSARLGETTRWRDTDTTERLGFDPALLRTLRLEHADVTSTNCAVATGPGVERGVVSVMNGQLVVLPVEIVPVPPARRRTRVASVAADRFIVRAVSVALLVAVLSCLGVTAASFTQQGVASTGTLPPTETGISLFGVGGPDTDVAFGELPNPAGGVSADGGVTQGGAESAGQSGTPAPAVFDNTAKRVDPAQPAAEQPPAAAPDVPAPVETQPTLAPVAPAPAPNIVVAPTPEPVETIPVTIPLMPVPPQGFSQAPSPPAPAPTTAPVPTQDHQSLTGEGPAGGTDAAQLGQRSDRVPDSGALSLTGER